MKASLLLFGIATAMLNANAQSLVLGKWKSVDETTGTAKSIVEISERDGKAYGKVLKIFTKQGEDPDPVCDKCSPDDPRFNKKIIGMEIISEMNRDDESYSGGTILDPEVGKVYRCKLWIEGKELKVRGYIGPFYRTQTWVKFAP